MTSTSTLIWEEAERLQPLNPWDDGVSVISDITAEDTNIITADTNIDITADTNITAEDTNIESSSLAPSLALGASRGARSGGAAWTWTSHINSNADVSQ